MDWDMDRTKDTDIQTGKRTRTHRQVNINRHDVRDINSDTQTGKKKWIHRHVNG